jgi:hypothetical protein
VPLKIDENLPTSFATPKYLTLTSQKSGVITLIDKSLLPKTALEQADNIFLYEEGQAGPRPGVDWLGTAPSGSDEIIGLDYFDFDGAIHLLSVTNDGKVWRSTDDATTWTECTGATFTADIAVNMNQNGGYMYMTNGTDNIVRYDGTTTLQTYTSLATPGAPSAAETGLATGTAFTYYYKVARVNEVGFSAASPVNTGTIASNLERTNWNATTDYVTVTTPTASTGQTRWDIYISTDNVDYFYLSSVTAVASATATWVDDGTAIPVPSTLAPTDNTTQGPLVEELTNVGSRQFGVRDSNNRYRIWFTGAGVSAGAFSSAYDGGYLDWQEGGKLIPKVVKDYRDGKGTPLATVWCDSADGQGGVLQMSLETLTVGDISVTVPSAYLLPGSRGTPSPGSVVNVLNDYMFYNSQAFYNLGSRAQFLNLLSTDESSANIRPTVKQITKASESTIASAYFDAKVYFSVGYGSSTNNNTIVYDTERKAWLPYAFTLGFKKFLRYTTTGGSQKLLCLKPGDSKVSEISTSIRGDYGAAFTSTLKTGLYPISRNRFEFQWTEQAELEFSNPTGEVGVELIGIERGRGFTSQGSTTVTSQLTSTGWDTFLWDTTLWDDTSTAIDTFSESSVKRYFRVGRELNAVQWKVTTNTLDAGYVLRALQTWGTDTNGGLPRSWRLDRI